MRKLVLAAITFFFLVVAVRADTYLKDCAVLDTPGETYYLTTDIINSNTSYCINISADNVILDCQGHTINGNTIASYGIYVSRPETTITNITIKNCVLTDWDTANIYFENVTGNVLENIISDSSLIYGIFLENSNSNNLIDIIVSSNAMGLRLSNSNSNVLTNINASSNYNGIYLENSNYNTLSDITANYNSNYNGIHLDRSNSNTLSNIIANFNYNGIYLTYSSSNTLSNITANSNSVDGIYFDYSDSNTIKNSIIQNNSQYGIYLHSAGIPANSFYNNLFNNTNNFYFDGTIYSNNWNTTRQSGTRIYSAGIEIGGNYWTNATGNGYSDTCTDADKDGFCDDPYVLNTNNVDYLALSNKYSSGCTELNVTGDIYYMTHDIIDSSATTCINITADNVVLDCQGHRIDGLDTLNTYGIYAYRTTNVTIKNCVVTDWNYGIYLSSSNFSTLSNIKFSTNDYGIYLDSSNSNTLSNIITSSGYIGGIYLSSSNSNTLSNITANSNAEDGISLSSSNSNTLSDITANSNDYGIYFDHSNSNTLSNITANSNIWYGIYLTYSNSNTLSDITADSNRLSGIYLSYSSSNTLINIISNSNGEGISLYYSGSTLSNITANYNGNGIKLYYLNFNTLSNINVSSNSNCAIWLEHLSSITFSNITANYNGYGICFLDYFSNSTFSNITANYNNFGIYMLNLFYSTLSNITANYNNYGIYFYSSNSNTLSNMTTNSNSYGIVLYDSNSNTIENLIIQNNSQYGIYLSSAGSTPNLIYNNLFNNTNNFYFDGTIYSNNWNTTRQVGSRIYSNGTEIGGNYWTNPGGNGYSDTCTDSNRDGFCDDPYVLNANNTDYLALSNKYQGICSCTDWMAAECVSNTQRKYTRICTPPGCDVETKYENDPTCAAPVEYPWLGLLTILLSPFWIVLLMAFGMSTNVESKLQTGGMAFLVALIIFLFVFAFYTKTIPLWIPIIFLIIAFGYIMIRGRI